MSSIQKQYGFFEAKPSQIICAEESRRVNKNYLILLIKRVSTTTTQTPENLEDEDVFFDNQYPEDLPEIKLTYYNLISRNENIITG